MLKKLVSLMITISMTLSLVTVPAYSTSAANTGIAYSDENIVGGNIYYDVETGAIIDCDNSVTSADIPSEINGVIITAIGGHAFYGCNNLISITIPDSITEIGSAAFFDCWSLTSLTIPESVVSIGGSAFYGCSNLTSLAIPESVVSIGGSAFYGCSNLTSLAIPESVVSIGRSAFYGCSNLTRIDVVGSNKYYMSIDGVLFDKDCKNIICYPSKKDGSAYTIPNGVTTICSSAFYGCSSLTNVTIPESVTSIGDNAFRDCNSLMNAALPKNVVSIGNRAFCNCSSLKAATIPEGVTSIDDYTFRNCSSLVTVSIPKSVYKFGMEPFSECDNILVVYYGGNEEKWNKIITRGYNIGDCFRKATIIYETEVEYSSGSSKEPATSEKMSIVTYPLDHGSIKFDTETGVITGAEGSFLTTVEIPAEINGVKVKEIGKEAFTNCKISNGLVLPDTITRIGEGAFRNSRIRSINIPASVQEIEKEAFYNSRLKEIKFSSGVKSIGEKAFFGSDLEYLELPNTVKNIGNSAFEENYSLETAILYGNIGDNAFAYDDALTSVEINGNCGSIGDGAFSFCSTLKSVKLCETVSAIGKQAFYNCLRLYDINLSEDLSNIGEEAFSQTPIESGEASTVGSLNIYGGDIGTDYIYSEIDSTLTILSSENMIIENNNGEEMSLFSIDDVVSGQALVALAADDEITSGQAVNVIAFADNNYDVLNTRIVIAGGVDAVLTLDGVDIDGEGEIENALSLESGSSLGLTLMGDNTLIGGNSCVGIDVPKNAELIVDGSGSLTLSGGSGAADIDGSAVINGGTITANGDIFGFEENVTFNGGIITFSDEYVNLGDDFDGVVYVGEVGEVHGDVVISQDTTLPEDTNLYIPADEATLTIAENALITIPSTSNLTITYGGKEITITPLAGKDCVMGTYGENGLDLYNGTIVIEGDGDLWLTCITVSDDGGVILFNEDGSIEVPAETYVEINLDDGITVGQYGGIIRPNGTVTDNVSVLLDSQGGSFIFIPPVPTGDKITKPNDPIYDEYIFGGWYKEADCINAWDFENNTANENITLYAKWTATSDDNTGNTPDDKTDDASSGKVSRGGGGGRSSSAAVKKADTETEKTETQNETDETDETKEPVATTKHFTDVKDGMWYTEAVNYAVENGLFFGTSDTLFSPNAQMTRGMIATVLYRAEGEPKTSISVFTDVVSGEWYADGVNWAAENNIVSGFGNGLFKPNNNITREQLAAILYRYAGSPAAANTALTFADTDKVSSYAKNALLWATENGIIYGKDNNMLDPQGEATRAEVAAMLMRYFAK